MAVYTKKVKIVPMGDKEEVNRVYQYIRDAQYTQYLTLNRLMSQVATLYYKVDRDIKSAEWVENYKLIFRASNPNIQDLTFPTGLALSSSCGMKVKQDFSTTLKNGLAKGERTLPTYKRDIPLLTPGRFVTISKETEEYNEKEVEYYKFKWVNKINFKIVLGTQGKRDYYLTDTLDKLSEGEYKACGSSIRIEGKNIYLYLVVKKPDIEVKYEPKAKRVMGVAMGYNKPITIAFSDSDKQYSVGSPENFIEKRQYMQSYYQKLQSVLRDTKGGKGRKKKLQALERCKAREKNFAKSYNHILSKQIIDLAVKMKVESINLEYIDKDVLKDNPIMLRNWSYYQLYEFIKYKAAAYGITVNMAESSYKDDSESIKAGDVCCKCGAICKQPFPKEFSWTSTFNFVCTECGESTEYSYNKAKVISVRG